LSVQRAETIASLIRLFREHKADSRRFHALEPAIRMLGEWRAVEACGLLVEHLTFPRIDTSGMPHASQMMYREHLGRGGPVFYDMLAMFPAPKALTQIGLPSVEPVMNRCMAPMDLDEAHVRIVVVARILGEEQTVALLRRRLDDTKDPIRRQIIEIELKLLEEQAQKKRE